MGVTVSLYSNTKGEIERFLSSFYSNKTNIDNNLKWTNYYNNSVESADIIGTFIDNNEKFNINMWISLDEGFFLNVTNFNADKIIRYLYERYPY